MNKLFGMNHHTRDISNKTKYWKENEIPYYVSTDYSNYGKLPKTDKKRLWGVNTNYLNILRQDDFREWKIIIHDDISFDKEIYDKIHYILEFAPKTIISFYNPTNNTYRDCLDKGNHVLRSYAKMWFPCHAIHKNIYETFQRWCDSHHELVYSMGVAEDVLLEYFLTIREIPAYVIVPSIVQHEGFDSSVLNNPAKVGLYYRNSENYNPNLDVKNIDWKQEFSNSYNLNAKAFPKDKELIKKFYE